MDWRPYKTCCQRYSSDGEIGFCPECAHPLLRCMAFAECGSVLSPAQACPVCVAPHLMMEKGAVVQSKQGERLSVPLTLHNGSPAGRPLWIKRIAKWDAGIDEPVALTWDRIDAGTERRFTLDTPPMVEGGTHTLRVIIVMATRFKGIEEEFAFTAGMSIAVSSPDTQNIYQTVTVTGNQFGTGALLNHKMESDAGGRTAPAGLEDRVMLPLDRAEKYELDQGIRGYREDKLRVQRNVDFTFAGFRSEDSPADAVTLIGKARLACGRNSRQPDPSANAVASDVCLRAYEARSGDVDEPATMAISRHHFDLLIVNDRLCVQARTTRGMQVNTTGLASGEVLPISPGDRIVPIPGRPEKLTLQVEFSESIGTVDRINVSRTPAMNAR